MVLTQYNQIMIKDEGKRKSEYKIIHTAIALVLILFIAGNLKSINESLNGIKKIEKAKAELNGEKKLVENLEKELKYIQTDEYIEKEAFERFRYTKDGGTVLVMQNQNKEDNTLQKAENTVKKDPSNLDKWIRYFKLGRL